MPTKRELEQELIETRRREKAFSASLMDATSGNRSSAAASRGSPTLTEANGLRRRRIRSRAARPDRSVMTVSAR